MNVGIIAGSVVAGVVVLAAAAFFLHRYFSARGGGSGSTGGVLGSEQTECSLLDEMLPQLETQGEDEPAETPGIAASGAEGALEPSPPPAHGEEQDALRMDIL